jgi:RNA polymerase sigma-70 factor (ECF subfamily)
MIDAQSSTQVLRVGAVPITDVPLERESGGSSGRRWLTYGHSCLADAEKGVVWVWGGFASGTRAGTAAVLVWASRPLSVQVSMPDTGEPDDQQRVYRDETALIERAKRDPEAFALLYDRYVPVVFAFAFSKVRDQGLAEDLTSQTFLQVLRALPRYEQRGIPFRSWLLRVTANLIVDAQRSHIPTQSLQSRPPAYDDGAGERPAYDPPDPRAQDAVVAWEGIEDFGRLIAGLTPEQQEVLRLRFADGLAIAEIAGRLSRSEGSVKMLILRALQHLRRTVGPEYFSDRPLRYEGEVRA